jgi:NADH-quinone oxidoreductase subunit F
MVNAIKSIDAFFSYRDNLTANTHKQTSILVCAGGGCLASGSLDVSAAFREEIKKQNIADHVMVIETGCQGLCAAGPVVTIQPDNVFYENVSTADVPDIIKNHIMNGKVVERLVHKNPATGQSVPKVNDIDFFKKQTKIVLRNCGKIDPLSIEQYIANQGYSALAKVLSDMNSDQIVEEVTRSGLRGRGGAGFLTGKKWGFAQKTPSNTKYVLCNADEGDPGAFMDRSVLEGDPHSVIEGMAIAGYAIGAEQGYVYVRAEYPLAVERLTHAIAQAREYGLLGQGILGTSFNFDLEIRMGSGAFVCGEETALIASIEGARGEPRPRPPFPADKGLWNCPSLLNNVETFANIAAIFLNGADWFASYGTKLSKGTKVFALAGAVHNTGLVEIPIGTTLGDLIYDIGGGMSSDAGFKAAQIGGPSGGCVPKEYLNVPLDYESLQELGAIMGSGGLIIMDEQTCMVDVARYFLEFVQEESCGKCTPCRVGTKRMLEIITRICSGTGTTEDIDTLKSLGIMIKDTALCGLGQTAPNPVLSTMKHFLNEYIEHIRDKHCTSGICPELVRAACQNACPANVDIPGFVSLVGDKRYAEALRLHRERNPFASVCARVCFHTCEDQCQRSSVDSPVSIRGIKRFMVEQEVTLQVPEIRQNAENEKKKIAIVGSGPAGLSCAYFLARLGYRPVVFEAEQRPGGMLVQTIPAYRLPREELAREIRMIENMGVSIETNMRLGKDFTLQSLKDNGYTAVFLAIGAPNGTKLNVKGEDADGVYDAIEYLRQYNIRGSVPIRKRVVIIGGGNAAIDASRTALRLGAESVTIMYRRTKSQMPAYEEEVVCAEEEGVKFEFLVAPTEIVSENNVVTGVKFRRMSLGDFDRSGRRRPTDTGAKDDIIEADQVIVAIGQYLDNTTLFGNIPVTLNKSGFIEIDPVTGQTSADWIFAGGDTVTGASSVVQAVGSGERAAVGIDKFLTGEEHAFWRAEKVFETSYDPEADIAEYERASMRLVPVIKRKNSFSEVELPWMENVAVKEAKRCLRCDYGKPATKK